MLSLSVYREDKDFRGAVKGDRRGGAAIKDEAPLAPVRCIDDKSNRSEISDSGEDLLF